MDGNCQHSKKSINEQRRTPALSQIRKTLNKDVKCLVLIKINADELNENGN